jgi:hypothetical protein
VASLLSQHTHILITLIQQPQPSGSKAGESWVRNKDQEGLPTKHLTHAVNLCGTNSFTSPPKEVHTMDFVLLYIQS